MMNTNNFSWGLTPAEPYIAHSGVKGMHWRERRYQYEDGTYTELGKARRRKGDTTPDEKIHNDYKHAHSNRDPRTMSTKELNDFNNRRNAEKQYSNLTKGVAATVAATVATQIVTETLKNYGSKAVKSGIEAAAGKAKEHPKATAAIVIAAVAGTAIAGGIAYSRSQNSEEE